MLRFYLACALCCCCLAVFAQEGTIRGVVLLADGTRCVGTQVIIRQGVWSTDARTDEDGIFERKVKAGDYSMEVVGVKTPVKVDANLTIDVTITIPMENGLMVAVAHKSGLPSVGDMRVAWRSPDGDKETMAVKVGGGNYWILNLPEKMTALSLLITLPGRNVSATARHIVECKDGKPPKDVVVEIPDPAQVTLTVLDADGKPLANTRLNFTISYPFPNYSNFWGPLQESARQLSMSNFLTTDANGKLDMGALPPANYVLLLKHGDVVGPSVPISVDAAGKVSAERYTFNTGARRIVQTVFDAKGNPVPNALVTATYCWGGKAIYVTATADAKGVVTWEKIPPVRVITFGPTIAPGVIDAKATEVTAPLPAPKPERAVDLDMKVERGNGPAADMQSLLISSGWPQEFNTRVEGGHGWHVHSMQPGAPFSFIAWLNTTPPKACLMLDYYLPYIDGPETRMAFPAVTFPQEAALVRGSFVGPDGTRLPGVCRMALRPVELPAAAQALMQQQNLPAWLRQQLTEAADGTFTIQMFFPGKYRLALDLFDTTLPANPALEYEVKPGVQEWTVRLPEPLAKVTGGATFYWVTTSDPLRVQSLPVPALADQVPVFGPSDRLLACWYQASPNRLMLWQRGGQWQSLPLKGTVFAPRNPMYSSSHGAFQLFPALPGQPDVSFELEERGRRDFWAGTYLVGKRDEMRIYTTFDVPVQGRPVVDFRLPLGNEWPSAGATALVKVRIPSLEGVTLDDTVAKEILVTCDLPMPPLLVDVSRSGMQDLWLPRVARTLSLSLPGVGSLRDVAIERPEVGVPEVLLKTYTPGTTVTGTLVAEEGAGIDIAGAKLLISSAGPNAPGRVRATADAQGRFTLKGLPPGQYVVYLDGETPQGGWMITVPAGQMPPLALRIPRNPVRLALTWTLSDDADLWWCPQDGTPRRLALAGVTSGMGSALWRQVTPFDVAPGPGELLAFDVKRNTAFCAPLTLRAGMNLVPNAPQSPGLGLVAPLTPKVGVPGAVTLQGTGTRAGVAVTYPSVSWQPASLLGAFLARIPSVPPGTYRVTVSTATGPLTTDVTLDDYGACAVFPTP